MLLFRSEEHLQTWLGERNVDRGAVMTIEQQWQLADNWYPGRLDEEWERRSPAAAEEVFARSGLTGEFWRMTEE